MSLPSMSLHHDGDATPVHSMDGGADGWRRTLQPVVFRRPHQERHDMRVHLRGKGKGKGNWQ